VRLLLLPLFLALEATYNMEKTRVARLLYNIQKPVKVTTKLPNGHKKYQMATHTFQMSIKYINICHFEDPPKFTQIVIFGLKIYHLATLERPPTKKYSNETDAKLLRRGRG
jgi:hypothetical protein